ncbi:methylation-associated defense system protein kinase MAD6 [Flavobacterium sp. XS2P39]|uniref:methylation-associated defense system protein kinase MAD6 n=1 Tax=Flavobacterium sp. XS2P39 TaxID=3401725 RepID=UPI003AAF8EE5
MAKIIKPPYFDSVVNAGEKRLLDFLEANLPESFYLIPNVEIASTNPRNNRTQYWEYDIIVVAPHAIYNIENKDWKGRIEGDDNYWYINDKQRNNPLKTGRQKTAILASKLREYNFSWGKAWVQNMVTLSFPNTYEPSLWKEAGKLTFQLNEKLINYLKDPYQIGQLEGDIAKIQTDLVQFLTGKQSQKAPNEKHEVEGYEIIEVLHQENNYAEYLVKPKGVASSIQKRVKEYALQISGLTQDELSERENQINNQYKALNRIKAKPFILNVEFRIDEENHLFYEISDYLDENSLKAEIRSKTFTFQEKINIIHNIMAALKEAHKENVFHRDINPENIFMTGGYAYLGNFGKSYFSDESRQGYTVMPTISISNATAYHPLELTVGDASRASDIYSLGVLIYWLFTGLEPVKTPFELNNLSGKLPEDRLPSKINSTLPKWLDELCNKTILVDESLRYDNIEELEEFFNKALKGNPSSAPETKITPIAVPAIDTYDIKEGDSFERVYLIQKVLGKGGYSRVFKVLQQLQGESFTLKLFHESVNAQSVIDEYKALKKLDHSNIVKFVGNGKSIDGQFYTIMEYLEGENLSIYTRTDARLSIKRVFHVAKDILSALVAMQSLEQPILHRDVKPQNIVWDNEQRFVLIDFNVASFADDNNDFVGTNPYLAPDLIVDGTKIKWNTSADTFALGITLYELLCKQYPWSPGKLPILSKDPIHPKQIEKRLSDDFANYILKAINPRSEGRFATAKDMLDALLVFGEDGILESKTEQSNTEVEVAEKEDFVKYINSLFSQSKHGNSGTRASFNASNFDQLTYTPTKLDNRLIPAVLDGQFKLLIITGNAGDGKTAFIRKIEEDKNITHLTRFGHKNGAKFRINGVLFESNYDGSQDEDEKVNHDVLENFFQPFENLNNYNDATEGRVIAINEGRLVEFLKTTSKHNQLHDNIENYFYNEGHHELPEGLMIINLNLRSIAAKDLKEPSLFRQQIKALTKKELWKQCDGCSLANQCFIKYNVESFNDSATGEEIITRMEWLLRTAALKRELHVTMRDLRSFIAYTLTHDYDCGDVERLYNENLNSPEIFWQNYYFNITNPMSDDSGNQDRLIKLLRETDIGEVAIPDLDRDLFFGKHQSKSYLEFAEREINLLDTFNAVERIKPTYEQDDTEVIRIKAIQKNFVRHQYFEGKAGLLSVSNSQVKGDNEEYKKLPSYLLRLPYHSVFKFVRVLSEGDINNDTKTSISRAISLNEGCDNAAIDKEYLILSSTEINDPFSKSFRLFSLDDFELFVNRTGHLVKYLEYEPDSLTFRHKMQKHIKLTVSLDLYEMLHFIQQGFSPSLNDLRGKFVELIIFKNLLENLNYNEVVVTKDNLAFFRISKDEQSRLLLQPMDI